MMKQNWKTKKIYIGIALILLVAMAGFAVYEYTTPYLPRVEDEAMTKELTMETVPTQEEPVVTSEISTKTSKKKVTIKTAATKSYTKNLGTKSDTTKKDVVDGGFKTSTETKIDVTTTERYKKGSQVKEVITKTVTTVTKTVCAVPGMSTLSTHSGSGSTNFLDVRAMAPMMDDRVLTAFDALGFQVVTESSSKIEGVFDAQNRQIVLSTTDSTYIYHQLGHFLSFILDGRDSSKAFKKIFKAEAKKFKGSFAKVAKKSSGEFFAECVREYCVNNTKLKGWCPKAYKAIRSYLEEIDNQRIMAIKNKYAGVWKS